MSRHKSFFSVSGSLFFIVGVLLFSVGTGVIGILPNNVFQAATFQLEFSPTYSSVNAGDVVNYSYSANVGDNPNDVIQPVKVYVGSTEIGLGQTVQGVTLSNWVVADDKSGFFSLAFGSTGTFHVYVVYTVLLNAYNYGYSMPDSVVADATVDVGSVQYEPVTICSGVGGWAEVSAYMFSTTHVEAGELKTASFPLGTVINFRAQADSGYSFSYWLFGDGSTSTEVFVSKTLSNPVSAIAVFSDGSNPTPIPTPVESTPLPTASPTPSPAPTSTNTPSPTSYPTSNPTPTSTPSPKTGDMIQILAAVLGVLLMVLGVLFFYFATKR